MIQTQYITLKGYSVSTYRNVDKQVPYTWEKSIQAPENWDAS